MSDFSTLFLRPEDHIHRFREDNAKDAYRNNYYGKDGDKDIYRSPSLLFLTSSDSRGKRWCYRRLDSSAYKKIKDYIRDHKCKSKCIPVHIFKSR